MAAGGAAFTGAVVVLARRQLMSFRYTLGWMALSFIGVLGAVLTPLVQPVAELFGMSPTGVLLAGATFVLLVIALQLSVSVSGLQAQVREMAEAHALLPRPVGGAGRTELDGVTASPKVLVVVPAWNEAVTVGAVVGEVRGHGYDVLVVDDGSVDDTAVEAAKAGALTVRLPVNLGVGAALRCGFRFAVTHGYDAVVQVDADGQHPAHAIDALVDAAVATGAHLVVGSRWAADDAGMRVGRVRRAVMNAMARTASRAAGVTITDSTSGFRVISEPLLSAFAVSFPAHYLGDTYEAVISAGRAGYTVREIAVAMRDRSHGRSSASPLAAARLTFRALVVAATGLHFPLRPAGDATRSAGWRVDTT